MAAATRRAVLAASLAGLASAASAQGWAQPAAPAPRFSTVAVDVGTLRAQGVGPAADLLQRALTGELRRAFADRLGGPGPRLVVRVTGLSLNAYAGSDRGARSGLGGSGTNTDYLEGEALVVGPRGEILARHPQLSAVPASSGGAWYLPDSEPRRVVALAQHFAAWLTRTVP